LRENCPQLIILGFSNIDIPYQYHSSPRKEVEDPDGLHCIERGSFIWVVQVEGEER